LTFGWLVGEPIRRVTSLSPGGFIAAEIARPLHADLWLGLPEEERPRLARIQPPSPDAGRVRLGRSTAERGISLGQVFPFGLLGEHGVNDPAMLSLEVPGGGVVASAPALARVLAATVGEVDGVRLLGEASVRDALIARSEGADWEGATDGRFSTGFKLNASTGRKLLSDASFGHDGAAGELAFADAEAGLGFAYINGSMRFPDDRAENLVLALRECLT
jgi:CubicO group peptidase (beta-lactamase class C family)